MPGEPPGCQKPERHPAAIREEAAGTAAVASWPAARQTATGLTHDGVCVSVCACACHVAQSDPEGPIRVNTVILLGRIAPLLRADTRDAVRAGDGCQHATHAHDVSIACVDLPVCRLCRCVAARRRSWVRLRKPCATPLVMYDSLRCGVFRQRTRASTVSYVSRSSTPVVGLWACSR